MEHAQKICTISTESVQYQILPAADAINDSLARMYCTAQVNLPKDIAGKLPPTLHLKAALCGENHVINLETSIATAALQIRHGYNITAEAIQAGIAAAKLPGRFQVVPLPGSPPLSKILNPDPAKMPPSTRPVSVTLDSNSHSQ